MKKAFSFLFIFIMLLSSTVYAHAEHVASMPEVALPQEPKVVSDDIAYLAYERFITSSLTPSGLAPYQARKRYGLKGGSGVLSLVDDNGGTVVFCGSGYGGVVGFVFEDLGGPVLMTAVDPKTGKDHTSTLPPRIDPGYTNLLDDTRMNGKWYWKTENTSSPTVVFEGEYIFDSITLFRSSNNKTELGVADGGALVIGKNTKFENMPTVRNNVSASVDEGGVLFLHTSGLSSYSGNGIIVADKALFDEGKLSEASFEGFEGVVMDEEGSIVFDKRDKSKYTEFISDATIETVYAPQTERSHSILDSIWLWVGVAAVSSLSVSLVMFLIIKRVSATK